VSIDFKQNKKVLILSNVTSDLYSMRKEVIEAILKAGYEVIISAIENDNSEDFIKMGCKIINSPIDRRGVNPAKDLLLLIHYFQLLTRFKPDIVSTYTIKPNLYGGFACSMFRIPYLSNITGLGTAFNSNKIIQKIIIKIYRAGLKRCSCLFFQNTQNYQFLVQKGVIVKKHRVIPGSGVNLMYHCYTEYPTDEEIRFLFIGRVMKEKGIIEFLTASERIKMSYPNVKFDIIGSLEEEFQGVLGDYQERGIINYYGRQQDVHSFIKRSHATILPSYNEGMSNVLLESAATGRPVIASNIAGCRETFDEGISGFGFEARNSEDLANKIAKFIELPYEEKKAMGIAGRKKMESEFNRELVVKAYLDEIEKILRIH